MIRRATLKQASKQGITAPFFNFDVRYKGLLCLLIWRHFACLGGETASDILPPGISVIDRYQNQIIGVGRKSR